MPGFFHDGARAKLGPSLSCADGHRSTAAFLSVRKRRAAPQCDSHAVRSVFGSTRPRRSDCCYPLWVHGSPPTSSRGVGPHSYAAAQQEEAVVLEWHNRGRGGGQRPALGPRLCCAYRRCGVGLFSTHRRNGRGAPLRLVWPERDGACASACRRRRGDARLDCGLRIQGAHSCDATADQRPVDSQEARALCDGAGRRLSGRPSLALAYTRKF